MDQEERAELVARLFAQMTGKLEDEAHEAAEGQRKGQHAREQIARVERLEILAIDVCFLRKQSPRFCARRPPEQIPSH